MPDDNRIRLVQYGIPRLGEFYPSDNPREFIKVPLEGTPEHDQLKKLLDNIDKWMTSDKMKKKLFGKNTSSNYTKLKKLK